MIEWAMLFGLGFVIAWLMALIVINRVIKRTERLTQQRVQATTPLSMPEIQADKDQMRAEFAMATRRLEMSLENLRERAGNQVHDLGEKGIQIQKLTDRLDDQKKTNSSIEVEKDRFEKELILLRSDLRNLREESAELSSSYKQLNKDHNLVINENSALVAETTAQRTEEAKLRKEVEAEQDSQKRIKKTLASTTDELKSTKSDLTSVSGKLKRREEEISKLEATSNVLRAQIADLEQQLSQRIDEKVSIQGNLDTQSGDIAKYRAETESYRRNALELEQSLRSVNVRLSTLEQENHSLLNENEDVKDTLRKLETEIFAKSEELTNLRGARSDDWEEDRVSSTLLRERINDMAAEITSVTAALEGENGFIQTQLRKIDEQNTKDTSAQTDTGLEADLLDRMRALQRFAKENEVST